MYQRSADVFLGLPFNICSTALFTHIVAKLLDVKTDKIVISIGDAHIYKDHLEQAKKQLTREPYELPQLHIENPITDLDKLGEYKFEDFKIENYQCHPGIKAKMVA